MTTMVQSARGTNGHHPAAMTKQDGGFVAQGPGFYIWDEDPREVLEAVCSLVMGSAGTASTARFMVIAGDAAPADRSGAAGRSG